MSGAAGGGGLSDALTTEGVGGLGVAAVLMFVVGRQMMKLWGAWSEFSAATTKRAASDESRADQLQEHLNEAVVERARLEERCRNQEALIAELRAVIARLTGE